MNEAELTAMLRADGELAVERLDHWARVAGERTFFHYGEDDLTLSYAEFGARSDAIAGNLAALGIAKGDHVSVFSLNPLLCALAMFGIWKAGAVYCPVNFGYTGRLLSYQLNDTAPSLVITDPALLEALNGVAADLAQQPLVCVYQAPAGAHDHGSGPAAAVDGRLKGEVPWADLTRPAARPDVQVAFDDPANIIYTSGTTGPSKGVVQPHRWMAQYTFWGRKFLCQEDVIYNDLPMYHVGGAVFNVVRAAMVGCEVAVWNRFSPGAFWDRIHARGATTAVLLDVMIPWLTKAPESPRDRFNSLNKVHMQPLPESHAAVARRFGLDFVTAGFGQTESGGPLCIFMAQTRQGEGTPPELYKGYSHEEVLGIVEASGIPVATPEQASITRVMGVPSPFFEAAVLDERDQVCAPGQVGQLALRPRLPALIMQEYLGKPEKTVAAWRNLWFHTGDAAVRHANGMFAFVDRLGDRIRVRGENLSSFQVEDVLAQHPAVELVTVFAVAAAEGDEDDIAAFATPAANATLTEQALREFAEQNMPKYMRPRHIRIVSEIPRTATNKIEKYKLRAQLLAELRSKA
ncbi:MAG: AMP-binding protein [Ottowia sp.]|uniref:class I adenylate-forming enzyme family protein n=1 Tax=Ottowia sp. TaxID=1898956 RepID=UPI0039E3A814